MQVICKIMGVFHWKWLLLRGGIHLIDCLTSFRGCWVLGIIKTLENFGKGNYWVLLSDEQMRKEWHVFSVPNAEQITDWGFSTNHFRVVIRIAQVVDVQVRLQTTMVASSEVMKVNRILYIWHNRKLLEAWNFERIVATSPEFNPNKVHESLINHPKINPPIFQGLEKRLSFEFCIETLSMFFLVGGSFFPERPKCPNEIMKSDGDLRHQTSWVRDPQFLLR